MANNNSENNKQHEQLKAFAENAEPHKSLSKMTYIGEREYGQRNHEKLDYANWYVIQMGLDWESA